MGYQLVIHSMPQGTCGDCKYSSYHIPYVGYVIVQRPESKLNDTEKKESVLSEKSGNEGRIRIPVEGTFASPSVEEYFWLK